MTRAESSRTISGATRLGRSSPLTVLVAGGDDEFRQLVKQHLGGGVQIVGSAANVDEAVSLAGRLHPDIVLLDTATPLVDGPEAARRIKAEHAQTKVVLLTSGEDGLNDGTVRAGADDPSLSADALLPKKTVVSDMLSQLGRVGRGGRKRRPR